MSAALTYSWYRVANRWARYHTAGAPWVRTGRAICGADISRPGFAADACDVPTMRATYGTKRVCGHCARKLEQES